jgi:glutathione S-transferase
VQAVFDEVARRLDGREYLVGDRFSRADLSFAALSAAVLIPENYGVPFPRLDELPQEMAEGAQSFRDHPAGAFALRMYARHRRE